MDPTKSTVSMAEYMAEREIALQDQRAAVARLGLDPERSVPDTQHVLSPGVDYTRAPIGGE